MRNIIISIVLVLSSALSYAQHHTYTTCDDFSSGVQSNLNCNPPGQLELKSITEPFPFIWVACSGRGTVVRIDVTTGEILGEYWTAPVDRMKNPSRTTVDLYGNVWVGNRGEAAGTKGSVVKIGLVIGGTRVNAAGLPDSAGQYLKPPFLYNTCIDRDGDGLIRTSRGLGDILNWPSGTDGAGGNPALVEDAEDECILIYQRVDGDQVRHVTIDANNNVYTGANLAKNNNFNLLDGNTGTILKSFNVGYGGYGGLVDGNGILWSTNREPNPKCLLRYNTTDGTYKTLSSPDPYGLAIDSKGNIWNTQYERNRVRKFDSEGRFIAEYLTYDGSKDRGVVVTPIDDHVWVANSDGEYVTRLDNDGKLIKLIKVGKCPYGIAVDANSKVWATNYDSNEAVRIDPTAGADGLGEVDLRVALGAGALPYNYSDMTGMIAIGTTAPQGSWIVTLDGGKAGIEWGTIYWNREPEGKEPTGTKIKVEVRAANIETELPSKSFIEVDNGVSFVGIGIIGRFIEIRTTLSRPPLTRITPTLSDLTVMARAMLECNVQVISPPDSSIVCDSVEVAGEIKITNGIPPYTISPNVNGIPADVYGDVFMARVPVASGYNPIIAKCTVIDSLGNSSTGSDTIVVFRDDIPPTGAFSQNEEGVIGTITDTGGGIAKIVTLYISGGFVDVDDFTPGDHSVVFRITREIPGCPIGFDIQAIDLCGNSYVGDPIMQILSADGIASYQELSFPKRDQYFHLTNHGLTQVKINLNGKAFSLITNPAIADQAVNTFLMPLEGTIAIDMQLHLLPINNMIIEVENGLPGTMAEVAITDFYERIDYLLELQPILPGSFNLSQNYPNPFNLVTNIQFDIPAHANGGIQVQLNIYNVVGQLIRTLVDETKFPGQYTARWDGRNDYGEKVPSGIYFYTLTTSKFKKTRKMMLLK